MGLPFAGEMPASSLQGAATLGHHMGMHGTSQERTSWIVERARAIGFDLCGVAPAKAFEELSQLPEWLERGYAGEMAYLRDPRRGDPSLAMPGARSVIVVGLNYNSPAPYSTATRDGCSAQNSTGAPEDTPRGWISRYAWGDDYHEVLGARLEALLAEMRTEVAEPFEARAYVDTGPVVERVAAKHAGLGWLAKNTCLINQQLGSWLFLGVIVTTLELRASLAPGQPPAPDLCGSCTRCLDACPTEAFAAPYVLDARRCISYLTIELRGEIPEEFRGGIGNAAIGCDICQDVCPWNRKSPVTSLAAFQPRTAPKARTDDAAGEEANDAASDAANDWTLESPELEWLASLTQEEFSRTFRKSAVKRAKWRGLVRNACVALGNSRVAKNSAAYGRIATLLGKLAVSEESLIAEHARWALQRLGVAPDYP